jgi:cytochrome c
MSWLDFTKIAGALLVAAVGAMVIDIIGDHLVHPSKQKAATMTFAAKAPSAPEEVEKAIPVAIRLATANAAKGKKVSAKCKSCHDLTAKKKVRIGPPLWDIVQAGKGGTGKYKYSSAMSGMGGKWSYEDLDAFLASPKGFMRGTKMAFPGIKNAKDRANLIAFLRSLSNAPKPMPQ